MTGDVPETDDEPPATRGACRRPAENDANADTESTPPDETGGTTERPVDFSRIPRRAVLALGAAGVAGCASLFDDETDVPPGETPTATDTERSGTPTGSATPRPTETTADAPTERPMTEDAPTDTPPVSNTRRTPGEIQDESDPGPRYAAPGDVASELNRAATGEESTVVRLYPDTTYRPTQTWEIGRGITLDYNGSTVEMAADVDCHDVQPGGQVRSPVVDLRSVSNYTSSVFRFDSAAHGFYGSNRIWHVRGGLTRGRVGEGTLFEFHQGDEEAIYFVHVDHSVRGIGTVVDMRRGDAYGINGVHVYGLWFGFTRGIHMHNEGVAANVDNMSGNHFEVIAQPTNASEILWDLGAGKHNVLRGRLWDFRKYSDVLWRIRGGDTDERFGNVLYWQPIGGTEQHLLADNGLADVLDDQLGDSRNRIVIPWLQGLPVSEFTG